MRLALTGGTVYISPADEPLQDAVVLIDGDKIEAVGNIAIPRFVERLDCFAGAVASSE
jgi:hypothetical protein